MVLLAVLLPGYGVQAAETAVLTLSCDGTVTRLTDDNSESTWRCDLRADYFGCG
jgi:hypothetical protein